MRRTLLTRLAALAAILALVASLRVVLRGRFAAPVRPPVTAAAPPGLAPGEDPVARALRLARIDSSRKSEWVDEVIGVDPSGLSRPQRARFIRFANAERCTCGCGFTLAACRAFDASCEVSLPRVTALLDSAAHGLLPEASGVRERPAGGR